MAFFAEIPEPDPEPEQSQRQVYFDHPGQAPQHWLPGLAGVRAVVGRTKHTAVWITFAETYPRGVVITLDALLDPAGPDVESLHRHYLCPGPSSAEMRLGLLWPDGRRAESATEWGGGSPPGTRLPDAGPRDGALTLQMQGSQGGGITWHWSAWLWPLPPPGPVEVYLRWDARDIAETVTTIDLTSVVAAADRAEELWPLSEPPEGEEYGWFAYPPGSSRHRGGCRRRVRGPTGCA